MTQLSENDEPKIDFNSPEDVLIEVVVAESHYEKFDWNGFRVDACMIICGADDVMGAASYEAAYGGFLNYTIESLIDCPGEGCFVVEGVTGQYFRGDGWMTDDDMEFYHTGVRPATPEEIAQL